MSVKAPERRSPCPIDRVWEIYFGAPPGSELARRCMDEIQRRQGEYELPEDDE